jgi:hypothetical protein
MSRYLIFLFFLAALTAASHASDGRYEISEHCAVLGCFPGDPPGLPVIISQPGSYVLTSNLTTSDVDQTLIQVSAHNVSVDLNGFSLVGPVSCTGSPNECSASGVGNGIYVTSCSPFPCGGLHIRNGTVRGMGRRALEIHYVKGVILENLSLMENGSHGIFSFCGAGVGAVEGLARNLVVTRNGGDGLHLCGFGGRFMVTDSIITDNSGLAQRQGSCSNNRFVKEEATSNTQVTSCYSFGTNFCRSSAGNSSC